MRKLRFFNNRLLPGSSDSNMLLVIGYDSLLDRLELIYRFKKLYGNVGMVSERERSFINALSQPEEMIEIIREYEAAITKAALDDEALRLRALARLKEKRTSN